MVTKTTARRVHRLYRQMTALTISTVGIDFMERISKSSRMEAWDSHRPHTFQALLPARSGFNGSGRFWSIHDERVLPLPIQLGAPLCPIKRRRRGGRLLEEACAGFLHRSRRVLYSLPHQPLRLKLLLIITTAAPFGRGTGLPQAFGSQSVTHARPARRYGRSAMPQLQPTN